MEVGDLICDRYRIDGTLGRGGAAEVYAVTDTVLGESRALKLVTAGDAHDTHVLTSRARREADAMRAIEHPHVLALYEAGELDGRAYLVMDRVEGSLLDRARKVPLRAAECVVWMLQVLSALAAAHDIGVVHRDVKPQNILLDSHERALLADFGIALVEEATRLTHVGGAMGSNSYMPPEQRLDARAVGPAADIYSSGSTLFRLLTDRNPVDLFMDGAESARLRDLPPALRSVILGATRMRPEDRYGDARLMAAALSAAMPEAVALDKARQSKDETERVAEPSALPALETAPEERFDRHARLSRRLLGTPIALVSIVDRDRLWFKSHLGLDAGETTSELAFCTHAVRNQGEILEVTDARRDPRFSEHPLVQGPSGVRFYAGIPIRGPRGSVVGSLCVMDRRPRTLDDDGRAQLRFIAGMVEAELRPGIPRSIDKETGLSDRNGFVVAAMRTLWQARRSGVLSVVLHFAVESDPGSAPEFSRGLLAIWDDAAVVARIAPLKFVVLTTGDGDEGRLRRLQRLRQSAPVGFSWAAAELLPASNESLASLMGRAEAGAARAGA